MCIDQITPLFFHIPPCPFLTVLVGVMYIKYKYFDPIQNPFPVVLILKQSSLYTLAIHFLGVFSAYQRKHAIFDLLRLEYFTQHNYIQFHQFSRKQLNFIHLYRWILPSVYIPYFLYQCIGWWAPRLIPQFVINRAAINRCEGISIVCWLTFLQIYAQECT
jgi:hypothetical protein